MKIRISNAENGFICSSFEYSNLKMSMNLELPPKVECTSTEEELNEEIQDASNKIRELSQINENLRKRLKEEPQNFEQISGMLLSNTNELVTARNKHIHATENLNKLKGPRPVANLRTPTGLGGVYTELAKQGIYPYRFNDPNNKDE